MRNPGKGGMQSSGAHYAIYCPMCGKPAARMDDYGTYVEYLHFTRKGSVIHAVSKREEEKASAKADS